MQLPSPIGQFPSLPSFPTSAFSTQMVQFAGVPPNGLAGFQTGQLVYDNVDAVTIRNDGTLAAAVWTGLINA